MQRDRWHIARRWRSRMPATVPVALALGFAAAAVASIGTLAHRALWAPLSLVDATRIVRLESFEPLRGAVSDNTAPDVDAMRRADVGLAEVTTFLASDYNMRVGERAVPIAVTFATAELWRLAAVAPAIGATYSAAHDRPGGDARKVVLSDGLWRMHFGADPGIVGSTLTLGTASYEVLGVMPAGFAFPERADAWVPLEAWFAYLGTSSATVTRGARMYGGVARLAAGMSSSAVQARLDRLSASLAAELPASNRGVRFVSEPFAARLGASARPFLLLAMSAATALWLTALAALVAARAAGLRRRAHATAIRVALGASGRRLARDAASDGAIAGLVAAAVASFAAPAALVLLATLVPEPHPAWLTPRASIVTLAIAWGLAGLPPPAVAMAMTRWSCSIAGLARTVRGPSTPAAGPLARLLGAVQFAAALALLVIGVGMLANLRALLRVDPGFTAAGLASVYVSPPGDDVAPQERGHEYARFYDRVLEAIRTEPATLAAGAINVLPLKRRGGWQRNTFAAAGQTPEAQARNPFVNVLRVSDGYFDVMRIPLLAGRDFASGDRRAAHRVAIVNKALADRVWPGLDPLGRQIKLGTAASSPWATVVGVAGDVRSTTLAGGPDYDIYFSYRQVIAGEIHFVVRSAFGEAEALAAAERAVRAANGHTAIFRRETLSRVVGESLWEERLWGCAVATFAALACLVAAASLYAGLVVFAADRQWDLAVRAALGARPRHLAALVVREACRAVVPGAVIGVLLAATAAVSGLVAPGWHVGWAGVTAVAASVALMLVGALSGPLRAVVTVNPMTVVRSQ